MVQLIKQSEAIASKRTVILYCVDGTGLVPYTAGAGGTVKALYPGATTLVDVATLTAVTLGTGHYYAALPTSALGTIGPSRLVYSYVAGTVLEAYADLMIVPWDPYDSTLGIAQIGTVGTVLTYTGTVGTLLTYLGTMGTVGTVLIVGDKTGYSLAANQAAVTIGTLNTYLGTVGTIGMVVVVGDKTGYSLAADQSAVTIGTVNTVPAIGSVGTVGTLGAQAQADVWAYATRAITDKVGFSLAADQSAVTIGTVNAVPAIGSVGTVGTLGAQAQADIWAYATRAITDKAGFSLAANQATVTIGTLNTYLGTVGTVLRVGSLLTQAKADVNAEVVDAIGTDAIAELGVGAPSATPSLKNAVMILYMDWRNQVIQTSTLRQISNDVGTVIAQSTLSDTGTIFTKTEYVSG